MKTHWRIAKIPNTTLPWQLQSMHHFSDGTCSPWEKLSNYKTRKQALTIGMLLRDHGEPISWEGGAIRMGIALVESN
jgi:hypothetical protein